VAVVCRIQTFFATGSKFAFLTILKFGWYAISSSLPVSPVPIERYSWNFGQRFYRTAGSYGVIAGARRTIETLDQFT
jgi:hypothetical protein